MCVNIFMLHFHSCMHRRYFVVTSGFTLDSCMSSWIHLVLLIWHFLPKQKTRLIVCCCIC